MGIYITSTEIIMIYPVLIYDYKEALKAAILESLENNVLTYLIRSNSGGYIIDITGEVFSDEKLVMTIFKGEAQ
jgi:hypothetical protein